MDENQHMGLETPKKSSKSWIYVLLGVIVVAALGVGAWVILQDGNTTEESAQVKDTNATTQGNTPETATATEPTGETIEIIYNDDGFERATYAAAPGDTIKVVNNSKDSLEFSSDDHPTHLENSELNQPVLASGASQEFTVNTLGTWGIHDHFKSNNTTTLVVE